jgi:drug/metabolite transporter (DMT)-like permease
MKSNWRIGLPLALIPAMLWGMLPVAISVVLRDMDAITVTWYRFIIAGVLLSAFLALTHGFPDLRRLRGRGWKLLALAVAGLAANYVIFLIGLEHTSPTVTQVVSQLGPLFLMLSGLIVFREHLHGLQRLGMALLLGGLLLFFNRRLPELAHLSGGLGLGVALLVLAAVVWTFYGTSQKVLQRQFAPQHILLLLYVGCALVLLPLCAPTHITQLSPVQLGLLAFCGINTLFAYGAFAESLKHWEISRVGAVLATTPLFTLLTVRIVARFAPSYVQPEDLGALSIFGAFMVAAGSALCALGGAAKTVPVAAAQPSAEC